MPSLPMTVFLQREMRFKRPAYASFIARAGFVARDSVYLRGPAAVAAFHYASNEESRRDARLAWESGNTCSRASARRAT